MRYSLLEWMLKRDMQRFVDHGYTVVEAHEIGNYTVGVVRHDASMDELVGFKYQLSLNKAGLSLAPHNQWRIRAAAGPVKFSLKKQFQDLIGQLLDHYKVLGVISHNPAKTRFYKTFLTRTGFKVEEKEIDLGHTTVTALVVSR